MNTSSLIDDFSVNAFHKAMSDNPSAVYLVEAYDLPGDRRHVAVFSTKEKADAWMATLDCSCVCAPFIIDEPGFGNERLV